MLFNVYGSIDRCCFSIKVAIVNRQNIHISIIFCRLTKYLQRSGGHIAPHDVSVSSEPCIHSCLQSLHRVLVIRRHRPSMDDSSIPFCKQNVYDMCVVTIMKKSNILSHLLIRYELLFRFCALLLCNRFRCSLVKFN